MAAKLQAWNFYMRPCYNTPKISRSLARLHAVVATPTLVKYI